MDAVSLSCLSRSEIIALAKANKIKANLSTKEIIRQLLQQFPDGVPALSAEDAPVPKPKKFMGRIKDALKTVTRTSKRESPNLEEDTPMYNLPNSTFTEAPSDVDSDGEEATVDDNAEAADPDDIRLVVGDMAAISARNKQDLERASALRARASDLDDEARELRAMYNIEKARRIRMENFLEHWREMDPSWSFSAIWEGPVVLAPLTVGYDDVKGRRVMDMEITSSDDEELVKQWNEHDEMFRKRRKARKSKKAKERRVPLDSVSDDELASDEDEFYNPAILRGPEDNDTTTDFERYVYPAIEGADASPGIMCDRPGAIVPAGTKTVVAKRLREEEPGESGDERRYSVEYWKAYERKMALAMGGAIDEEWEGLGATRTGWRMSE